MTNDWKKLFHINTEVRFGQIIDNNGIKLFYDEGSDTKTIIRNLSSMIISPSDFRSIMIAGYAGVGKTTLLHYIKNNLDLEKYELFIINGEENIDNNGIIHELNKNFERFYNRLFSIINIDNRKKGENEIKFIVDKLFASLVYISDSTEKTRLYLEAYTKLCENKDAVKTGHIRHLRIALDQIDLLDNTKFLEILKNSFVMIIHSKYIIAIISARPETLDSAKRSINNFFATNFDRFIDMKSIPAEYILKKRLEASSTSKVIAMPLINSIFTNSFCDFMNKIHNGNIRKALSVYEHIMGVMPVLKGKQATDGYTNFLLDNNYIDNLYLKINPTDNIPIIKIVFDALQYKTVADNKFHRVVYSQILIRKKNSVGVSRENIKKALEYLKAYSLITESFDITDSYNITPKGEAYRKLIITDPYKKLFCKSKDDKEFAKDIFDDVNFS
jgi:hypothetical protein